MARPTLISAPTTSFGDPSGGSYNSVFVTDDRVAAVSDGHVSLWARASGELLRSIPTPAGQAGVTLTPRLDALITEGGPTKVSGELRSLTVWSLDGLTELGSDDFPGGHPAVSFAPDGAVLVRGRALGGDGYTWRCDADLTRRLRFPAFDPGPLEPLFERFQREIAAPRARITGAALGTDVLALLVDGHVRLLSLPSLDPLWSIPLRGLGSAVFVGPQRQVVVGALQKAICLGEGGAVLWEAKLPRKNAWSIVGSENGETLVLDTQIALRAASGAVRAVLPGNRAPQAISPDGRIVASADGAPGVVNLYELP